MFVAIGEAAKKRDTAVMLLIDEIQYLQKDDLSALIMAMHKIAQRQLPLLLFGGGLPQLAKLAGDAKSYAERLFDYPPIGPLDDAGARLALSAPAEREGVKYAKDALDYVIEQTGALSILSCRSGARIAGTSRQKSPITLGRRETRQRNARSQRSMKAFSKCDWRG